MSIIHPQSLRLKIQSSLGTAKSNQKSQGFSSCISEQPGKSSSQHNRALPPALTSRSCSPGPRRAPKLCPQRGREPGSPGGLGHRRLGTALLGTRGKALVWKHNPTCKKASDNTRDNATQQGCAFIPQGSGFRHTRVEKGNATPLTRP